MIPVGFKNSCSGQIVDVWLSGDTQTKIQWCFTNVLYITDVISLHTDLYRCHISGLIFCTFCFSLKLQQRRMHDGNFCWNTLYTEIKIYGGVHFFFLMYLFFNVFNTYTDKIPSTCFKIAYGFVINELNKVCDYTFSDMIKINFSSLGSHPHTLFERLKRKISQTVCQHYVLIIYFNPDIKSIIHFWLHAIEQWEKHIFKILGSFNP